MDANDLKNIIIEYNQNEVEIWDRVTDHFIKEVRNELEKIFFEDRWAMFLQVETLGIKVNFVPKDFYKISFEILQENGNGYFTYRGESCSIQEKYNLRDFMSTYWAISAQSEDEVKLCGLVEEDIKFLVPFLSRLIDKGFEIYTDDSDCIVISFRIQ